VEILLDLTREVAEIIRRVNCIPESGPEIFSVSARGCDWVLVLSLEGNTSDAERFLVSFTSVDHQASHENVVMNYLVDSDRRKEGSFYLSGYRHGFVSGDQKGRWLVSFPACEVAWPLAPGWCLEKKSLMIADLEAVGAELTNDLNEIFGPAPDCEQVVTPSEP
jgi:hypothetical protein